MLRDAELLPYEIDDYDTTAVREALENGIDPEGMHPTGINKSRMRLPEVYDIKKYYDRLKRNSKVKRYDEEKEEYEVITRQAGEYGHWRKLKPEDIPVITSVKGIQWDITYNFPNTLHNFMSDNGRKYGGETVTYRRLYLILCERFNDKEYFIDTYFRDVYPYTIKEEVDVELQTVKDELYMYLRDVVFEGAVLTKDGRLSRRNKKQNAPYQKTYAKKYREYLDFKEAWEDDKGEYLARRIADDIKYCLASGQIPLNHVLTEETIRKRMKAGYDPDTVFYAMGDLIDHIQIYVKIRS
jgi:hypothetical protein